MSWNPIEFSYKVYPESGRATFVSHMCSYIERLLVIFGIICAIFGYWRGIVCGAVMLGVAYLIHIKNPTGNSSKTSNKFCTECGAANPREAKFCGECGNKF